MYVCILHAHICENRHVGLLGTIITIIILILLILLTNVDTSKDTYIGSLANSLTAPFQTTFVKIKIDKVHAIIDIINKITFSYFLSLVKKSFILTPSYNPLVIGSTPVALNSPFKYLTRA